MGRRIGAGFAAAGLAAGAALLLAGCSGGSGDGGPIAQVEKGLPSGWDEAQFGPDAGDPVVGWVVEGESFAVVTWGSSSCPPIAKSLGAPSASELRIVFAPPEGEVCTADFAPTTHEFALPDGVTERPIAVEMEFEQFDETVEGSLE